MKFNTLSKEQKEFVKLIKRFKNEDSNVIMLTGGPGTGKTYVISYVLEHLLNKSKVLITAPTNKATLNIKNMLDGDASDNNKFGIMTTHKALQLKVSADSEVLKISSYGDINKSPISKTDYCVIDESSMIGNDLFYKLKSALHNNPNLKLIVIGDKDQLFPPKEDSSPLMNLATEENTVHLLTNNRFKDGSNIDKHVKSIKECINTKEYSFTILHNNHIAKGNVISLNNIYSFIKICPNHIENPDNRILTWTRTQFKDYNNAIRSIIHGEKIAHNNKLLKGERFISYTSNKKENIFIGDEGVITHKGNSKINPAISNEFNVDIYSTRYELELSGSGNLSYITSLDNKSIKVFEDVKNSLYTSAMSAKKANKRKLWGKYWGFVNTFHEIEPAYAQTIHSSQGSTYKSVIVDAQNIQCCDDLETRYRLYYVAFSRAKHILMVNV